MIKTIVIFYCFIITIGNEVAKVMFLHLFVNHSVHRGRSASVHAGIPHHPPWDQAPPNQAPPPKPGTPLGPGPPDHALHQDQAPPRDKAPPCQQTATVADGTHPTGMHFCFYFTRNTHCAISAHFFKIATSINSCSPSAAFLAAFTYN